MPPDPKPPSRRRRRNAVAGEGSLPSQGRVEAPPPLPPGIPWLDWTREYWATIWSSPVATRWLDFDTPALVRLARLQERALFCDDTKFLAEIRQLEDRFGLNPRGRRLNGWEVAKADPSFPTSEATGDPSSATETTGLIAGDGDTSSTAASDASSGVDARQVEIDPRRLRLVSGA
jgi:hypothetical protein